MAKKKEERRIIERVSNIPIPVAMAMLQSKFEKLADGLKQQAEPERNHIVVSEFMKLSEKDKDKRMEAHTGKVGIFTLSYGIEQFPDKKVRRLFMQCLQDGMYMPAGLADYLAGLFMAKDKPVEVLFDKRTGDWIVTQEWARPQIIHLV